MDRLLSLSQAARLVGVSRQTLQKHIQDGRISTFEGAIRLSELLRVYPDAEADQSGMVEKVLRIQAGAAHKYNRDSLPDSEALAAENQRLKLELREAQIELHAYRKLTSQLRDRLYAIQEQCDRNQRVLLGTVISWLGQQMKKRR
jgi:CDP-4-dehydro-6-deoxyglucose reductase